MVGFVTAPSIAWGAGALEQLSGLGARRAAIVVDPAVAGQEGPKRALEELERGGASVVVLADRPISGRLDAVGDLAARLRGVGPDWIVAVGGGTTLDAVKAARIRLERGELDLTSPASDVSLPDHPRSRLVAIPTTSGSGAEASWVADVITDAGAPAELAHRSLVPDWAVVDPLFVRELAGPALVSGAFEVAALACEAYLSAWANPFSDALAVDALRTVVHRLPHAVRWSDDPDAREALHYAATEAGLAASNAQRGLAHALARALMRPTGATYASLLALILPPVLDFDRPAARERLEALALALRQPEDGTLPSVAERLRRLAAATGAPADLEQIAGSPATLAGELDRVVAETLRSPAVLANPRVPTADDVRHLAEGLLERGARPPPRG